MRSASWQRQDPISGSAVLQNSHSIHKAATLAQYPSPAKENCAATMGQDQNMEISHESLETPSFQKPLIFVVEDDVDIARLICHNLQTAGYLTRWFPDGSAVILEAEKTPPALFVLDIMLPGDDGFKLGRQIRRTKTLLGTGIVFLTARTSEQDRIEGLELGGDAYMSKPFEPRELVARVRALLRTRSEAGLPSATRFGRIEIDLLSMTVKVDGEVTATTMREFRLLDYLSRHPSRVFTRKQLLDAILAEASFVTERSVDVYIRRLRVKIEPDPDHPTYLKTVRGVGYRFDIPRK